MRTIGHLQAFLADRLLTVRLSLSGGLYRVDLLRGSAIVAYGAADTLRASLLQAIGGLERREHAGLRS